MILIEHKTFGDNRGSYTAFPTVEALELRPNETHYINWDQCSISVNDGRYTFRGMHYQKPNEQAKYVKVIQGSIIDFGYNLETGEVRHELVNKGNAVYLHSGYAHGFLTLEPNTIVAYMVKGKYDPDNEHSIVWHTIPEIKEIINKYTDNPIISEKDKVGK